MLLLNTYKRCNKIGDLAPLVAKWVSPLVVHDESQMVPDRLLVLYLVELTKGVSHDCD